jgi:hypothetical protein
MTTIKIGDRLGMLVVQKVSGRDKWNKVIYSCQCDCGNIVDRLASNLLTAAKSGARSHCGCSYPKPAISHGMRYSKEYAAWRGAKARCTNKRSKDYPAYGGAGITFFAGWMNDFEEFLSHIGKMPADGMQIDRINNRLGYIPGNVRWATRKQQQRNRRRTYVYNINGNQFESAQEAADKFGVKLQTILKWTNGFFDHQRNHFTPPKPGCTRTPRYE